MKAFLAFLTVLYSCPVFAQNENKNVIGHYRSEYYLMQGNGYFIVERLSPLKYNTIIYDTLLPSANTTHVFKGSQYALGIFKKKDALVRYILYTNNKNNNCEGNILAEIDDKASNERRRKYNFFYYRPYEPKISQYGKSLNKQKDNKYDDFNNDREEMYRKLNELSINEFKQYFRTFLKKYNLE